MRGQDLLINVPVGQADTSQRCSNCRFQRIMHAPPIFRGLYGKDVHAFCLRMPPVLAGDAEAGGFADYPAYPPVQDAGWCGEWSPRDEDIR